MHGVENAASVGANPAAGTTNPKPQQTGTGLLIRHGEVATTSGFTILDASNNSMFACLSSRSERGQHPSRPPFPSGTRKKAIRLAWDDETPGALPGCPTISTAPVMFKSKHAALPKRSSGCNSRLAHHAPVARRDQAPVF